jgi:hypothetical protein
MTMLRSRVLRFKAIDRSRGIAMLLVCGFAAGCYWSRYPEVMAMHLELLEQYAAKLTALAEGRRTVPTQDWGEFVYPLERARDFARIAAKRFPERRSLARFREVLVRYDELVASPELLARGDAEAVVRTRAERLEAAIVATRRALAEESEA